MNLSHDALLTALLADTAIRAVLFWGALHNHEGADRVRWFLVLTIPLLGTFAYLAAPGPSFESLPRKASADSIEWADGVLRRSGIKPRSK